MDKITLKDHFITVAHEVFKKYSNNEFEYLPSYDKIIDYIYNRFIDKDKNYKKSLAIIGDSGTGKTLIVKYIIPRVIEIIGIKNVFKLLPFHEFNVTNKMDYVYNTDNRIKNFIGIDDVGANIPMYIKSYGNTTSIFCQWTDWVAECGGGFFAITSNLRKRELFMMCDEIDRDYVFSIMAKDGYSIDENTGHLKYKGTVIAKGMIQYRTQVEEYFAKNSNYFKNLRYSRRLNEWFEWIIIQEPNIAIKYNPL